MRETKEPDICRDELERFEFSQAIECWNNLSQRDQELLLTLPTPKEQEIEWTDMETGKKDRARESEWKAWCKQNPQPVSSGGSFTGIVFDNPEMANLLKIGVAFDGIEIQTSSYVWQGIERFMNRPVPVTGLLL